MNTLLRGAIPNGSETLKTIEAHIFGVYLTLTVCVTLVVYTMFCRSKAWLQYARRPELLGKTAKELYEGYRLCSEHFTAKDFLDPGKTRLTKTAIPTVRPQMLRPSVTAQGNIIFICSLYGVLLYFAFRQHQLYVTDASCQHAVNDA